MGPNMFEACLRMTINGKVTYYALGSGKNNHFHSAAEVVAVFYALCWVQFENKLDLPRFEIKEIVRRWRDRSGNLIP